jgi:hypothetical protein
LAGAAEVPAAAVELAALDAGVLAVLALLGGTLVAGAEVVAAVVGGAEVLVALVAGWLADDPVLAGVEAALCWLVFGAVLVGPVLGLLGPGVPLPALSA